VSGDELIEDAIVLPALPGRELLLLRPRDAEAYLDREAFAREEYMPYWAELWPSALALAGAVAGRALHGARVVELGCGLGLPAIAAGLAGGRVLATDWSPDAVEAAARNAERNGVALETLVARWSPSDELVARGPFDLVIGSDLLYEARNVPQLLELLPRLVSERGEVWIADPGRAPADDFLARAAERFEIRSVADPSAGPRVRIHRLRPRARGTAAS
jgi:predicted nicotinamide N-methyase